MKKKSLSGERLLALTLCMGLGTGCLKQTPSSASPQPPEPAQAQQALPAASKAPVFSSQAPASARKPSSLKGALGEVRELQDERDTRHAEPSSQNTPYTTDELAAALREAPGQAHDIGAPVTLERALQELEVHAIQYHDHGRRAGRHDSSRMRKRVINGKEVWISYY